jgi:hypothetical protein
MFKDRGDARQEISNAFDANRSADAPLAFFIDAAPSVQSLAAFVLPALYCASVSVSGIRAFVDIRGIDQGQARFERPHNAPCGSGCRDPKNCL